MNITINNKKEILTNSLELELLRIAKEFDNTDVMLNYSRSKSVAIADKKSRVKDMKICIEELQKFKEYKNFIISVKSWTADLFIEELLLNREEISHAVFMYPFCETEHLYRVVLNDSNKLNGSIALIDRISFRDLIKNKSKEQIKSLSKCDIFR